MKRNSSGDHQPGCSSTSQERPKSIKKRPKLSIFSKRKKFVGLKKRKSQENLLRQTSLRMFAVRASAGKKSSCCKRRSGGANASAKLSTMKKLSTAAAGGCSAVTRDKSTLRRVLMASCGSQCFSSRDVAVGDDQHHRSSCSRDDNASNFPTFCNITAACCPSSSSSYDVQQQCCRSKYCCNRSSILTESSLNNSYTNSDKIVTDSDMDHSDNVLTSGQNFDYCPDSTGCNQTSVAHRLDSSWRTVGRERERLSAYCKSAGITWTNRLQSASLISPTSRIKFGVLQQPVTSLSTGRCSCCPKSSFNSAFEFQAQSLVRLSAPVDINVKKFRDGQTPLPQFEWADENTVWNLMCWKDTAYQRNAFYLLQHPGINARMRSILLDWLNEVCQEYRLHRETFYLAIDFIDRYLSREKNVSKENLQLVGVTALFVAAKLEEIYPPKCSQFAEMTAGACTVEQIESQELIMLNSLQWSLCPVTPIHWAAIYLQIIESKGSINKSSSKIKLQNCKVCDLDQQMDDFWTPVGDQHASASCSYMLSPPEENEQRRQSSSCTSTPPPSARRSFRKRDNKGDALERTTSDDARQSNSRTIPIRDFLYTKFQKYIFLHIAQLIDLCMLDTGNLKFPYSVIAACAFAHIVEPDDLILSASGYKPDDLWACYQWMEPFAINVQKLGELQARTFSDVPYDDAHNIQVRTIDLELLERSQTLQMEILRSNRLTPVFSTNDNKSANGAISTNTNSDGSIFNIYPTPPNSDERPNVFFNNNSQHHNFAAFNFLHHE